MSASEFPRLVRLDTIGAGVRALSIEADEGERAKLVRRFGLVALAGLAAEVRLSRTGETIAAEGRVRADATQACVVTGAPVPAAIDEPFALRFVPEAAIAGDEIELDEGDLDTIGYEGDAIDIGEAVAQGFALALDPFPRAPDADAARRAAGVLSEEEAEEARIAAGPFAALKALKRD